MKITVTGSLGNISLPLTKELIQQGHAVTVISSSGERQAAIAELGATAAIGSLDDVAFLAATFSGAEAAYCMIPFHLKEPDQLAYLRRISTNYVAAIQQAGIKRVVHLSGWAAEAHPAENAEGKFNTLTGVSVTHLRPGFFYTNFYGFIDLIKSQGRIASNFGEDDRLVLVSPLDIAAAAAEELLTPHAGSTVRYVASEETTCNEAAAVLGAAIGQPELKWALLPDQQVQQQLEAAGMPFQLAAGLVEMQSAIHSGAVLPGYYRHQPAVMGQVKLPDFAQEFAVAYHKG